jgi:hypothetical protein
MKLLKRLTMPLLILLSTAGAAMAQNATGRVGKVQIDRTSLCAIGRGPQCSIKTAIARGLFQTGLRPQFAPGARCRDIDEHYAIDYTYKRGRENYHGGIDMPAPFGTPIVAAAAGTVVAVYDGTRGYRGKEIILRHTPEDTGIPLFIYTEYAHMQRTPKFTPGDRVRMGETLGPTGNTGITPGRKRGGGRRAARMGNGGKMGGGMMAEAGSRRGGGVRRGDGHGNRRPAIHFAVFFTANPHYAALPTVVVPADSYWMDPVALYRGKPPFDSASMKALPANEKRVPIPYMLADGSVHPAGSKLIWPYLCTGR